MALRSLGSTLALLLGTATLFVVAPSAVLAPAAAATCPDSTGVTVIVDYRELGGGVTTGCAPNGAGKSAAAIFSSAGVSLSYATRQPGFVCRVNGAPTSDPCVNTSPANAYWGLWWSSATSGSWTYSSQGVGGLVVPAGGSLAWSWQQDRGSGAVPPGVAPPVHRAPSATPSPTRSPSSSPSPTRSPSSSPSQSPTRGPTSPGPSKPSSTATPGQTGSAGGGSSSGTAPGKQRGPGVSSASPSDTPSDTPSVSPSGSASGDASESRGDAGERTGEGDASDRQDDKQDDPEGGADGATPTEPSDAGSDAASTAPASAAGTAVDEPTRVPAALTWGVIALLLAAIGGAGLVARRRRAGG